MVYTNIRALDQPYKKAVVVGKKYYWLKVSEHFFEDEKIKYLESQENGEKYVYFWIKLLLKCLKTKDENEYGFLRFSKKIPYNDKLLSDFTGTDIDTVRVALSVFKKLEMIEILDDETIYIESVQEMIGSETEGAARVRRHRNKIALLSNNPVTDSKHYKRREEKEIEKEIEIEEAASEVYPRGPAPAPDDDDPTGPAKKLWAAAGIARPTPTTGDARTVAKATARGWTIQDLEAKAARAAAAEHDPLAYLRQVLTAAANEDPPTERATPAGGESWQTAWAEVSRHASAGVTRWGQVDELSPRARAAARAARQTIRYGTSSEAKWAFRDAWMAAEPQEASA